MIGKAAGNRGGWRRSAAQRIVLAAVVMLALGGSVHAQNPWVVEPRFGGDGGLVVELHDWNGEPASVSDIIVCDENYNPLPNAIRQSRPGRGIINTDEYDKFTFLVWSDVEGFGLLKYYADNSGAFYTVSDHRLDLNEELAKSRLENVRARMKGSDVPAEAVSDLTRARLDDAESLLNGALEAEREAYRLKLLEQSFRESLWAGERLVEEEARYRIENSPRRLAFKFGANAFYYGREFPNYEDLFATTWNYATVPFYLSSYEPARGELNTDRLTRLVDFLKGNGIAPKGHPLVWMNRDALPEWLDELETFPEVREALRDRVTREVSRWDGDVNIWDVITEAHDWANYYEFTSEQMIELTRVACAAAGEANPGAVRIVNLAQPTGDYAASSTGEQDESPVMTPYNYAHRLIEEEDVDFEVLGLQMYFPSLDMFEMARLMDRYAALGKPLHITEVAAPSGTGPDPDALLSGENAVRNMGTWHEPWSPELQAEWVVQFYRLCYAHPDVHAVSWWDFADYPNHYFPHGGLIDGDGNPKPAYEALMSLMDYWGVSPNVRDDWVPGDRPAEAPGVLDGDEEDEVDAPQS